MTCECQFFDLNRYSLDSEDWNDWDWPAKIWAHISDRQLSTLFDNERTALRTFGDRFPDERSVDETPKEIVAATDISARDIVEIWIDTLNKIPLTCQHEIDGEELCRFHRPPGAENAAEIREQILSGAVTSLVGANLSEVDLRHSNLDIATERTLRLDFCEIDSVKMRRSRIKKNVEIRYSVVGTLALDHAHFAADLDLSHTKVESSLTGSHTKFEGQVYGVDMQVVTENETTLEDAIFHRYVCFDGAHFDGKVNIWNAVFHADVEFRSTVFENGIKASWVDFHRFVDFHETTFRGVADFGGATFYDDAAFSEGEFETDLEFQKEYNSFNEFAAVFHGVADFTGATVEGTLNMRETEFKKYASFKFTEIGGTFTLWNAEFDEDADFREGTFDGPVDLRWSKFRGYGDFNETTFHQEANFGGAKFTDDIGFSEAEFKDTVCFRGEFSGYDEYRGECHGIADFGDACFEDTFELRMTFFNDVSFVKAEFFGNVDITATFEHSLDMSEAEFHDRTDFSGSRFYGNTSFSHVCSDQVIDMSKVKFMKGVVSQPTEGVTYYDFTQAVVGKVDFKPLSDENLFSYMRFYETDFDGFDFPHHGEVLMGNWQLHEFDVGEKKVDKNKLINTYVKAKNGANDVGSQTASSEFFLQEMRFRRKTHWDGVRNSSPVKRLTSGSRWLSNWFLNLSCGYGERPLRTISSSMFLICFFSVLYWTAGLSDQETPLTYLIFSTQAFVTLIFGETPVVESTSIQFLAAFQGFLGAFFIALFVFALTRSIHR